MCKILKQSTYDALISEIEALKSNNSKMLYVLLQNEELINKQNEEIETLKPKAEKYEKELKRQREKYNRLYKGKKKEPEYVIEGKSIKQLVEENLGIKVGDYELCGYDIRPSDKEKIPFLCGKNAEGYHVCNENAVILKEYTHILWFSEKDVIEAIKKHRNI